MIVLVICAFSSEAWPGPIHQVARTNDAARPKSLFAENPALADAPNPHGLRPPHDAAMAGDREAVELLPAKGARIGAGTTLEQTASHLARTHGQGGVAALLVEKGVDEVARFGRSRRDFVLLAVRSTTE
ncbi:MAG: hypothetical protein ACOY3Y_16345 [Acidobacteriota bacterium]